MASISCFCALHRQPTLRYLLASSNVKASSVDYKTMQQHSATHVCPVSISSSTEQACGAPSRRQLIILSALAAFTFPPTLPYAIADSDVDRIYTDDVNKFKIVIPQDWQVGTGEPNGFKSVTAFYPQEDSSSNVSVVITGVGPDFTKMESFGKVDEFAETLVSGLDRSWQRPPGVAAKLIDCKASKGFYYINYSLQNPGEARRYLYSAIGMASNGWYNRLYTVTGQFMEDNANKYGSQIQKAVASFRFV
ncbi:psbP domain-containing protein 3, chloroplastic [Neltuma alba]|uniref:psbP domain-containing protein 3, chloroplastic n=1 Tax=Neltuma alba TaxID=207710 RepID=UPI0010A59C44|nr:psbP domain-containing protein 3, chloroplastic-like [Prosopis alba]